MKLELRWRALIKSDEIADHVRRRMTFELGRFSPVSRRVRVCLADDNGPRGGVDKRCTIEVKGARGVVRAEARGAHLAEVIDAAFARVGRATRRAIDRATRTRRVAVR